MHMANALVPLLCVMAMAVCSWAEDRACLQPPYRDIKEHCWEVRGVDTSAGVSTAKWAWDWVKNRCVPVGIDCPAAVWKLFDSRIECRNQCKGTIGEVTADPDWHDPPRTTSTVRPRTPQSTTTEPYKLCGTVVDLVMLLDGSGSIEWDDGKYHRRPGFFKDYVKKFAWETMMKRSDCRNIPFKAFAIAVSVFARSISRTIGFDETASLNNEQLKSRIISKLVYPTGGTSTWLALEEAEKLLANRPDTRENQNVLKAVMLITDGFPTPGLGVTDAEGHTKKTAGRMRAAGISIISVGVGEVYETLLAAFSGHSKLVFMATDPPAMTASLTVIVDKVQQCYMCIDAYKDDTGASVKDCSHAKCIKEYM